jgi:hypothetical protein
MVESEGLSSTADPEANGEPTFEKTSPLNVCVCAKPFQANPIKIIAKRIFISQGLFLNSNHN